jgi:hypothetical protein
MLSGFNVHSIVFEVPAKLLTKDGRDPGSTEHPVIGAYSATYRKSISVLKANFSSQEGDNSVLELDDESSRQKVSWVQVQRLANPLVNEAIIGTVDKDRWNALDPKKEKVFLDYYLNPRLALALELVFDVPAEQNNRTDLVNLLLKYQPSDTQLSELLRLDLRVQPTPFDQQKRLGPLAHDPAGSSTPDPAAWPNGRRPIDDVTDVAVRVIGGSNYINALAGDGVNVDDAPLSDSFPFIATPEDGRNRVHQNP